MPLTPRHLGRLFCLVLAVGACRQSPPEGATLVQTPTAVPVPPAHLETDLDEYERDFRSYANPMPGRIDGVVAGPDGPSGPWVGSEAARARYFGVLWGEWVRLEFERAEAPFRTGEAQASRVSRQAVILRLLGGSVGAPLRDGGVAGVAEFVEAQRLKFETADRVHRTLAARGQALPNALQSCQARFRDQQLFLFQSYEAEQQTADLATGRRAAALSAALLFKSDGGLLPCR